LTRLVVVAEGLASALARAVERRGVPVRGRESDASDAEVVVMLGGRAGRGGLWVADPDTPSGRGFKKLRGARRYGTSEVADLLLKLHAGGLRVVRLGEGVAFFTHHGDPGCVPILLTTNGTIFGVQRATTKLLMQVAEGSAKPDRRSMSRLRAQLEHPTQLVNAERRLGVARHPRTPDRRRGILGQVAAGDEVRDEPAKDHESAVPGVGGQPFAVVVRRHPGSETGRLQGGAAVHEPGQVVTVAADCGGLSVELELDVPEVVVDELLGQGEGHSRG
jgi:hypothetical protein